MPARKRGAKGAESGILALGLAFVLGCRSSDWLALCWFLEADNVGSEF